MDHGKAVPTFIEQALTRQPLTVFGDGTYHMRLIYVDDIARAFVKIALHADELPPVIDMGTVQRKNRISVRDLAEKIIALAGYGGAIRDCPMRMGQPEGIVDYKVRLSQTKEVSAIIGFKVEVSLEDGLNKTIAYYQGIIAS